MRSIKKTRGQNLLRILVFGSLTVIFLIIIFSGGLTSLAGLTFSLMRPNSPSSSATLAPIFLPPPILLPLPSATNSAQIKLGGSSQTETTVEIFLNEETQLVIEVDTNGQFETKLSLDENENQIYAIAQDLLGNYSSRSEKIKIIFDNQAPELEIETPAEDEKFYQEKNRAIEIHGQTETNASLYLNDHLLILNSNGEFSTQLKLEEGENILKFLVKDQAGNETEKEIMVFYQP